MTNGRRRDAAFREFVEYFKNVLGVLSVLVAAIPPILCALGPGLIPPWPSKIVLLASGVCAFAVFVVFFSCRHSAKSYKRRVGSILAILTLVGTVGWLTSNSYFVVEMTDDYRVISGFDLRANIMEQITQGRVGSSAKALLEYQGWNDAESIWTYVPLARVIVVCCFIMPFALAAGCLSAYAVQDFR